MPVSTVIFAFQKFSSKLLQSTQYARFRRALFFTLGLCILISLFLLFYGKTGSFLLINGAHSPALVFFFKYCTYLGDGLIYIPLLAYCILFNRSFIIPSVLCIVICLLLTHFLKRVVFPEMLRPVSLRAQHLAVHQVTGVHLLRIHSFPSGHTATAFSTALLLVTVLAERAWAYILPALIALLVGYSRVYLAQHFVTDVLGGMVIGMLTAWLALWLHPMVLQALPQAVQVRLQKPLL